MNLKNASVSSLCSTPKTSGRRPNTAPLCTACGRIFTSHKSGLCYHCRESDAPGNPELGNAIEVHEQSLKVLKMRADNIPFNEIAATMDMSKTTIYAMYLSSIRFAQRSHYNIK